MLIYSRAIPEGDQDFLQWPEDVVVRCSAPFFLFLVFCLTMHPSPSTFLYHQQRAVQRHNQLFLNSVSQGGTTSTATSETVEISVPSSTSVSGFTTPLEMPVTPGEPMDVSN
jgi:hypothetical protein